MLTTDISRLKTTAQSVGALPPDPDLTMFTQQIFEQFWKAHGYPNEAEIDLLEQVGDVDAEVVDAWCEYGSTCQIDAILTSQSSSAKRLSSSNLQVNARSDESHDG